MLDILAKLLMIALLIAWAVRQRGRTEQPHGRDGFVPATPAAQAGR
jgi:hypothetical protein